MAHDLRSFPANLLAQMGDPDYRAFHLRLVPGMDPSRVLGVRVPQLRSLAARMIREQTAEPFLRQLPHSFYEEDALHSLLLSSLREYGETVAALEAFLPYVDNWAVCDLISPRAFEKRPPQLPGQIRRWLDSPLIYTRRFGLGMLLRFYLDPPYFDPWYLCWAQEVPAGEYYVDMMAAWYFATALAKEYEETLPLLTQGRLNRWVHNKTIQKAVESRRLTPDQKAFLRTLRRKE